MTPTPRDEVTRMDDCRTPQEIADELRNGVKYYVEMMYESEWEKTTKSFKTSLLNTVYNLTNAALQQVVAAQREDCARTLIVMATNAGNDHDMELLYTAAAAIRAQGQGGGEQ